MKELWLWLVWLTGLCWHKHSWLVLSWASAGGRAICVGRTHRLWVMDGIVKIRLSPLTMDKFCDAILSKVCSKTSRIMSKLGNLCFGEYQSERRDKTNPCGQYHRKRWWKATNGGFDRIKKYGGRFTSLTRICHCIYFMSYFTAAGYITSTSCVPCECQWPSRNGHRAVLRKTPDRTVFILETRGLEKSYTLEVGTRFLVTVNLLYSVFLLEHNSPQSLLSATTAFLCLP